MEIKSGQQIGTYTIVVECGSGAYGKVFLAENSLTKQRVALKLLSVSDHVAERELHGLMYYRDCRHPNLLQIHHIDKYSGSLYYTMDAADNMSSASDVYIPDTLSNRLAKNTALSAHAVNKMAVELLDGLEYLHKHGLIHRDIKPDNILWIDGRATLADIGLTCDSSNNSLVGTPGFMSEPLLSGKRGATQEDDLYALGKVIYCALTGCSVKEFPHYPATETITDADPLIKAYTAACKTPPGVRSPKDMRSILSSGSNSEAKKKSFLSTTNIIFVVMTLVFVLAVIFVFMRMSQKNGPVMLQPNQSVSGRGATTPPQNNQSVPTNTQRQAPPIENSEAQTSPSKSSPPTFPSQAIFPVNTNASGFSANPQQNSVMKTASPRLFPSLDAPTQIYDDFAEKTERILKDSDLDASLILQKPRSDKR